MCARCLRDGNIVVSSLIFVLGRLYTTSMRQEVIAFTQAPSDASLQDLLKGDHPLYEMVNGIVQDIGAFGGLEEVLAAAYRTHVEHFNSAVAFMRGDDAAS